MNYDNKGARMNLIRTRTLLEEADIVCVRFGDKYRQWNAAFDAGYATAKGIPVITLHPPQLGHMLKEVNAVALAVCEEPMQVVGIYRTLLLFCRACVGMRGGAVLMTGPDVMTQTFWTIPSRALCRRPAKATTSSPCRHCFLEADLSSNLDG